MSRPLLRFAVGTTLLVPAVACTSGNERPPTANPGPVQGTPEGGKVEVTPLPELTPPKPEPQPPIVNTLRPDPLRDPIINTPEPTPEPEPEPAPEPPRVNTPKPQPEKDRPKIVNTPQPRPEPLPPPPT